MIDFSSYKFRCSGLRYLMVSSRVKSEPLSESTKTYLRDIYIKEVYGRHKPNIDTKYTRKGTMVESDSLDLVQQVTQQTFFKNNKHFDNEFIQGTPDVVTKDDLVIDIKSSFDIWTFAAVDSKTARSNYFYQVLGYMWLTGKKKAQLMYCLVNTPEEIIGREMIKMSYTMPELTVGDGKAEEELRKNYIFDDIEANKRLKVFDFEINDEDIETLKNRVLAAREYLGGLTL